MKKILTMITLASLSIGSYSFDYCAERDAEQNELNQCQSDLGVKSSEESQLIEQERSLLDLLNNEDLRQRELNLCRREVQQIDNEIDQMVYDARGIVSELGSLDEDIDQLARKISRKTSGYECLSVNKNDGGFRNDRRGYPDVQVTDSNGQTKMIPATQDSHVRRGKTRREALDKLANIHRKSGLRHFHTFCWRLGK